MTEYIFETALLQRIEALVFTRKKRGLGGIDEQKSGAVIRVLRGSNAVAQVGFQRNRSWETYMYLLILVPYFILTYLFVCICFLYFVFLGRRLLFVVYAYIRCICKFLIFCYIFCSLFICIFTLFEAPTDFYLFYFFAFCSYLLTCIFDHQPNKANTRKEKHKNPLKASFC